MRSHIESRPARPPLPASLRIIPAPPCVVAVSFVGAFQGSRSFGDLAVPIAFGAIGWVMKRFAWARAPLILGFILDKLIEKNLFISMSRYGFDWLGRLGVVVILSIAMLILLRPRFGRIIRRLRGDAAPVVIADGTAATTVSRVDRIAGPALWVIAALGFVATLWSSTDWRGAARLMPQTAAVAGLLVICGQRDCGARTRHAGRGTGRRQGQKCTRRAQ